VNGGIGKERERLGPLLSSLAAIGSLIAATSCCLPLGAVLGAVGLAGATAFLAAWRPYLMGLSVLMLGVGFFQTYRARQCRVKPNALSVVLLWSVALLTVLLLGFPQVVAGWLAGR
jgi:hypothetical protein